MKAMKKVYAASDRMAAMGLTETAYHMYLLGHIAHEMRQYWLEKMISMAKASTDPCEIGRYQRRYGHIEDKSFKSMMALASIMGDLANRCDESMKWVERFKDEFAEKETSIETRTSIEIPENMGENSAEALEMMREELDKRYGIEAESIRYGIISDFNNMDDAKFKERVIKNNGWRAAEFFMIGAKLDK